MQIAEILGKRRESGSVVELNNLSGNLVKNMLLLGEIMTCNLGVLINFFLNQELSGKLNTNKWCSFW